jgi:hypothetical protein
MSAGYGRGHYGSEQLARSRTEGGSGWFKIAIVAGLGAAVYWWVIPAITRPKIKVEPKYESSPSPPPAPLSAQEDLEQLARSRGYSSAQEYQDVVRAMVDELQARGARVVIPQPTPAPVAPAPPIVPGVPTGV